MLPSPQSHQCHILEDFLLLLPLKGTLYLPSSKKLQSTLKVLTTQTEKTEKPSPPEWDKIRMLELPN